MRVWLSAIKAPQFIALNYKFFFKILWRCKSTRDWPEVKLGAAVLDWLISVTVTPGQEEEAVGSRKQGFGLFVT